ncbi:MAG: hypothetical protein AB1505_09345 [Candidatus Latescibacterota bacterium]
MTAKNPSFTFRTAQGVWINDMRNWALPHDQWPSVRLDETCMRGLVDSLELQAASGFNHLTVFGLLTASSWLPDLPGTVEAERCRRVRVFLDAAHERGLRVLYGLGVYSWGFDEIIRADAAVRGTNPHAMCGSRPESEAWVQRVVDYLLAEFDFDGFHLEASDQGRCTCPACAPESNTAYYSRLNRRTAQYICGRRPALTRMVNMCGYLPWGDWAPEEEWSHLHDMGRHLDFLVDAGHAGYFVHPARRQDFIGGLSCAFGTSGGVWVYPPQRWQRLRWFLPHTRRTGRHLEELYGQGGRAIEYYMGPRRNPGVEVNIAFGGRKLSDVGRDDGQLLAEVLEDLYRPRDAAARSDLVHLFEEAEEAFFASFDPLLPRGGRPRGEIHLTPLIGTSPGPPIYLRDTMTQAGRAAYARRLRALAPLAEDLRLRCRDQGRLLRICRCIARALEGLRRVGA